MIHFGLAVKQINHRFVYVNQYVIMILSCEILLPVTGRVRINLSLAYIAYIKNLL